VEVVSSKLGSGTILLGRSPNEHDELGGDVLVLEELGLLELVVIKLELVDDGLELLLEEVKLVGAEEDVDVLDDDVDETEISDELDGELEVVDARLQVLVVAAGAQYW
jgi:hypothetical protein